MILTQMKSTLLRFALTHYRTVVPSRTTFTNAWGVLWYHALLAGIIYILNKTQFLPPKDIKKIQLRLLKKTLIRAHKYSLFWRGHIEKKIPDLTSLTSIGELQKLPFTTKKILQTVPEDELNALNEKNALLFHPITSGTTGIATRVTVFYPPFVLLRAAFVIRALSARSPSLANAMLTRKSLIILNRSPNYMEKVGYMLRFQPDEINERLDSLTSMVTQEKIPILSVYPSLLSWLARLFHQSSKKPPTFQLIESNGEYLPEETRKYLESIFRAPIYRTYGMVEFGEIGRECLKIRGIYHINAEYLIVEIVDRSGRSVKPGIWGEIVITSLNPDSAMPLIRYKTGDKGRLDEHTCSCGITAPKLELQGRTMSEIQLPSGKTVPSLMVTRLFVIKNRVHKICQFQIVQRATDVLDIVIVPNPQIPPSADDIENLSKEITTTLDEPIKINIELTTNIPVTSGGKLTSFIPMPHK